MSDEQLDDTSISQGHGTFGIRGWRRMFMCGVWRCRFWNIKSGSMFTGIWLGGLDAEIDKKRKKRQNLEWIVIQCSSAVTCQHLYSRRPPKTHTATALSVWTYVVYERIHIGKSNIYSGAVPCLHCTGKWIATDACVSADWHNWCWRSGSTCPESKGRAV